MPTKSARLVSLVVAVVLFLVLLAACAGKQNEQSEPKPTGSQAAETGGATGDNGTAPENGSFFPLAEPIEITAVVPDFGRERNTRIDKEIEKRTNIKIKWQIIPGNYAEKVNTMLASGDVPDLIALTQPELEKYQSQGLFIDFSKYTDQMPNFQKWNAKFSDMENYFKTASGNLYTINALNTEGALGIGFLYRKDILDKNSLQLPATTTDMYNVLKQLKTAYPDSYPFYSDKWAMTDGMYWLYHTSGKIFFDQDTLQYKYGPEMSNYMDALRFARKLYTEGLVNPDFPVATPEQIAAQFNSGKGFMRYYWLGAVANDISDGQKVDPNFKLEAALPPVTDTGLQGRTMIHYPTNNWWSVTGNAKGKYVEQLVKYLDYQMSDEFIDLINWGFEGETYSVKDGRKEFIIGSDAVKGMGIDGRSGIFAPMDPNVSLVTAKNKDIIDITKLYTSNVEKIGIAKEPIIKTSDDFNTRRGQVMGRVDTAMDEASMKFIMNKIGEDEMLKVIKDTVDKGEYKEFVDTLNAEFAKIKDSYKLDFNIK